MNKGFTLIEILASIIVIGIILVITVPSYMYVYNSTREANYKNKVNVIKQKAIDYGETIKDDIKVDNCRGVLISDLIKKGYIKSDYTNKDALTNPMDNQEFKENLSVCYCKSDNNLQAFMKDSFDYTKGYTKGEQVDYNGVIYECMSSYSYNEVTSEMNNNQNKKVESRDANGNIIYVNASCRGYYNDEINLCITKGTTIDATYLINKFFKKIEC